MPDGVPNGQNCKVAFGKPLLWFLINECAGSAIWDGHKAKYQDTVSDEISCLQEQQMHERTQYCNDVSRISMTAFSIKSAGMNLGNRV